jgi:hypothetical protein
MVDFSLVNSGSVKKKNSYLKYSASFLEIKLEKKFSHKFFAIGNGEMLKV